MTAIFRTSLHTIRQYVTTLLLGVAVSAAVFALAGAAYVQLFAQAQNAGSPPMVGSVQYLDANGNPLTSGTISTFVTATGTSAVTYSDRSLNSRNANPVSLDSAGRASIFLSSTQLYRFIVADSANVAQITADGVGGANYVAEEHALDLSCGGRMTLNSGVPVTTTQATGATTIYFTPYGSDRCALYDGANWRPVQFTEASLSLGTDAANTNYDLFGYLVGTTFTLERLAWTNQYDRTTNTTLLNGIEVRSGASTRRWLGSYRTTATIGQTEDSFERRFVSNRYNRVPRLMRVRDDVNSWTYSQANYRQADASSANQLAFLAGTTQWVSATARAHASHNIGDSIAYVAIGDGTTSTPMTASFVGAMETTLIIRTLTTDAQAYVRPGASTWVWLERATAAGTTTWRGDDGDASLTQSGIFGWIEN